MSVPTDRAWRLACEEALLEGLEEMGLAAAVNEAQREKLLDYGELLREGNKVMNLTALDGPEDVARKHLADSLLPFCYDYMPLNASLVDVGTGAGLPGLPLAILRPDLQLLLLDSLEKRLRFLRETCATLGVQAAFRHDRAEDAARLPDYRDAFDLATSRAVAAAPLLLELALPFVKPGGALLAYKGDKGRTEFQTAEHALKELKGRWQATEEQTLSWGQRSLIVIKKLSSTPKKYPRKNALIKKAPL